MAAIRPAGKAGRVGVAERADRRGRVGRADGGARGGRGDGRARPVAREARRRALLVPLGGRAGLQGRVVLPPRCTRAASSATCRRSSGTRSTRCGWLPLDEAARAADAQGRARDGRPSARTPRRQRTYDRPAVPSFALNFYSPIVEAQLRSHRKTATIRLGDKSRKYQKGMIVCVLVGARYGPRQHVFDAVIDKVDVKRLVRALAARDRARQPGDPPPGGDGPLPRPALQPRGHRGGRGHGDPLLGDQAELEQLLTRPGE